MMHTALGMALVLGALASLFLGIRCWKSARSIHPEVARKTLHVGMGLVTLSFPWLFNRPEPVWILAAIAMAGLIGLRMARQRYEDVAGVLLGVQRKSLGEFYFIFGVAILFTLSGGELLLYSIPVLILTLADATAAIMGVRYGTRHYTTAEGTKTIEGSFAFFAVSFISTIVPLVLLSDISFGKAVAISATLGLLIMLLEAVALGGRDNIYLPLGAYALLRTYLFMNWVGVALCLAVAVGLVILVVLWRRRTNLDDAALLGAALTGYAAWAVGGLIWLVPPMILFLLYLIIFPVRPLESPGRLSVHAVVSVTGAGLFWLLIQSTLKHEALFYVYTLSFSCQLGITGITALAHQYPRGSMLSHLPRAALPSWFAMFAPYVVIRGIGTPSLIQLGWGLIVTAIAYAAFFYLQPEIREDPLDTARWFRQGILGAIASALGMIPFIFMQGASFG